MLSTLAKLFPFRDYAYAAIAVAALGWFLYHDHQERAAGAAHEAAVVQRASAATQAAASAQIRTQAYAYAASLKKVQETYETQIASDAAAHAADLQRLRQLAQNSNRPGAVLQSSAGSGQGNAASAGGASAQGLAEVPGALSLELVDALRVDDAALEKCWADRDSLTGL